jgi:predicted XRE-type DNA-binding protein
MRVKDSAVEHSSGNIFKDMGMPGAEDRLAKAELPRVIRKFLGERGFSRREAAKLLGVAEPDMPDLMRGRLSRFSTEGLLLGLERIRDEEPATR